MGNHHYEKWIFKTPLGLILILGGVFMMYYSITHFGKVRWVIYGLSCAASISIGVYLLSSAAVHKIKSDMIKKQKLKQQSG